MFDHSFKVTLRPLEEFSLLHDSCKEQQGTDFRTLCNTSRSLLRTPGCRHLTIDSPLETVCTLTQFKQAPLAGQLGSSYLLSYGKGKKKSQLGKIT